MTAPTITVSRLQCFSQLVILSSISFEKKLNEHFEDRHSIHKLHLTSSHFPGDADVAVADIGLETLGATPRVRVVHIPGDPTSAAVRANDGARNGRTPRTATARTAHTGIGGLTITWLQRPYESWQILAAKFRRDCMIGIVVGCLELA